MKKFIPAVLTEYIYLFLLFFLFLPFLISCTSTPEGRSECSQDNRECFRYCNENLTHERKIRDSRNYNVTNLCYQRCEQRYKKCRELRDKPILKKAE